MYEEAVEERARRPVETRARTPTLLLGAPHRRPGAEPDPYTVRRSDRARHPRVVVTPTAWSWWCRDGWRSATPSRCCTRSGCGSSGTHGGCARWSSPSQTAARGRRVGALPGRGARAAGPPAPAGPGRTWPGAAARSRSGWAKRGRRRSATRSSAGIGAGLGSRWPGAWTMPWRERARLPAPVDPAWRAPLGQLLVLGRDELQLAPPARPEEILAYVTSMRWLTWRCSTTAALLASAGAAGASLPRARALAPGSRTVAAPLTAAWSQAL